MAEAAEIGVEALRQHYLPAQHPVVRTHTVSGMQSS